MVAKPSSERCERGKGCERDRVERIAPQRHVEIRQLSAPETLLQQEQQRHEKPRQYRQEAGCERATAPKSCQRGSRRQPRAFGGEFGGGVAAAITLHRDQAGDDRQHEARELGGAGQAAAVEPGREDRHREGADAEIFAGADIVQRFQRDQCDADGQRRPRHRQRDTPEHAQRLAPRVLAASANSALCS